jgi:hypothetical protein
MRDRSDAEMIQDLQNVLRIHGKLTAKTIRATVGVLSPNAYWERFGSLEKFYAAVGYQPPRNYADGARLRQKTQQQKGAGIGGSRATVSKRWQSRDCSSARTENSALWRHRN